MFGNKRLCLQVENEEISLHMQKLEKEKQMIEIYTKMPVVLTGEEFDNHIHDKVEMDDEDGKVKDCNAQRVDEDSSKCCYLECIFAYMPISPPLDKCQGTCGKIGNFHHACNVNWLESKGIDAELRKLCFHCAHSLYDCHEPRVFSGILTLSM